MGDQVCYRRGLARNSHLTELYVKNVSDKLNAIRQRLNLTKSDLPDDVSTKHCLTIFSPCWMHDLPFKSEIRALNLNFPRYRSQDLSVVLQTLLVAASSSAENSYTLQSVLEVVRALEFIGEIVR